ncbi:PQQ-dependent sugar dehydrogenase [Paenibacillus sp. strain BS8-2]
MKSSAKIMLAALCATALITGCNDNTREDNGSSETATGTIAPTASITPTDPQVGNPTQTPANNEMPGGIDVEDEPYIVAAEKLHIPWSIAIAAEATYITEREGSIVRVRTGEQLRQDVRLTKPVLHAGEGGLMGLVLAPDYADSKLAYAYHTYEDGGRTLNRIVMLKEEGADWVEQQALLEEIPGNSTHNGGRLAIGPDGMLYATTGDAQQRSESQSKDSLAGKILRMTLAGQVPADNPFPNSYIYSFGHRNPQGLAWTKDGVMYSTEHGPSGNPGGHDEINAIVPGSNYGWPTVYGDGKKDGLTSPLYHTGDPAIAPSGTVIDGQGRLVIATLRGEAIYRYDPSTGKMEVIHKDEGRIRDVKLVGDQLWFITNNLDGRGGLSTEAEDRLVIVDYVE